MPPGMRERQQVPYSMSWKGEDLAVPAPCMCTLWQQCITRARGVQIVKSHPILPRNETKKNKVGCWAAEQIVAAGSDASINAAGTSASD